MTTRRPASTRCTGIGRPSAPWRVSPFEALLQSGDPGSLGHVGQPTGAASKTSPIFTWRCHTSGHDTRKPAPRQCARRSGPDEPFDVEPPYEPDHEALAAVEKYDDRFLDRELSWLRFNQRVLELAEDPDVPLLERVRFLAIFTSNLDEFFMVRVAGLKRRIAAGLAVRAASG